jgi:hypothetical protein
MFKVRCRICGEMMQLCPPRKNLRANLDMHLNSTKHLKALEDFERNSGKRSGGGISTKCRGRPSVGSRSSVGNQPDLHGWFKHAPSTTTSDSASVQTSDSESLFSLLCWGFRAHSVTYNNKVYDIRSLLDDLRGGNNWVPKPNTCAKFMYSGERVIISGCFHHSLCSRISPDRLGFTSLTCHYCGKVHQEDEFRKRVTRESAATDKRGTRYAIQGRRVDYLGNQELIRHGRVVARKLKDSKAMLWQTKAKITMLKRTKNLLKLSATDSFNRKEVLAFYNDILSAHRTNAFRGKPTL